MNRREFATVAMGLGVQSRNLWGDANIGSPGKIDETLRSGIARRKIPAVVGMAATASKTLYTGAFGDRDSEGTPVTADGIFAIASMTKAVTTVAAMQLVEQGKVTLDEPVAKHLPKLDKLDVLEGFDAAGKPILRPAKTPITLKHLLTHTSGLCYDIWDGNMFRYAASAGTGTIGPLMFEPGARWQYGQGCDWAGRLVEAISGMSLEDYFQAKILGPLEMRDTSYILPASKFDRMVTGWSRENGGPLKQNARALPKPPATFNGGGGLYSTAADYTRFMQMILGKGRGILQPKTVESMMVNQIGASTAGKMRSSKPDTSSDVDIQPGSTEKWGLGFLINSTAYKGGRAAGSLAWAGLFNTFYWIDPKNGLCAVILMQFLPFVDKEAVGLLDDFERAVYGSLKG
ncbi:MAG TPA: serine hydrolase domain-containing protein [Candidatus Solibacter sp.]|nr:serine hydrolase domain-containing protein [Candidatus Solibacter sp.]